MADRVEVLTNKDSGSKHCGTRRSLESTQSADTYTQEQHARGLAQQRHRHSTDVPPEHQLHQAVLSHRAEELIELVSSRRVVDPACR
jgi:hypothetical protein